MKELDKNKAYYLENLNNEELEQFRLECLKDGATGTFNCVNGLEDKTFKLAVFNDVVFGEVWCLDKNTTKEVIDAKELFTQEWTPQQGEKALVSHDNKEWHERVFALKYKGYIYCECGIMCNLIRWKYIKPLKEEIKISDWVKTNDKEIFKVSLKHNLYHLNGKKEIYFKVTDEALIELLEKQL